jgi:hypothetical protein
MASGNGRIVGITDGFGGRSVYVTRDGRNWTQPPSAPKVWLEDIKYLDSSFVAVGAGDSIFTSPDGENWTTHPVPIPFSHFYSVAHGNGATVAVGYYGQAVVSTDLTHWTVLNDFRGESTSAVAFGNGLFIAQSYWKIWTSPDGFNWTERQGPPLGNYSSLVFSAGRFAMLAVSKLGEYWATFTSTDGARWVQSGPSTHQLLATENGFLGVGNGLFKSSDATTWQRLLDFPGADGVYLTSAAELNGAIVVGGTRGTLLISTNGQTWEHLVKANSSSVYKIAYGNGEFLLYGLNGMSVTQDGGDQQIVPNAPRLHSAVYGNGVWVGATTNGEFATSADARTWTNVPAPFPARRLHFANGIFLAEPSDNTGGAAIPSLAISHDAKSWRRIDFEGTISVSVFGNVNGRWAAAISDFRPVTSEDGTNWTIHPSDPDLTVRYTAAGNDRFLSVGGAGMGPGTASWSRDGINWERQTLSSGPTVMEAALAFGDGKFLLTDGQGNIFTSTEGLAWKGRREAEHIFTSAAYGSGRWLVVGGDAILRSIPDPPSRPVKLDIHHISGISYVIVDANVGDVFEIESAPAVTGPWTVLQKLHMGSSDRNGFSTIFTNRSAFMRTVTVQP